MKKAFALPVILISLFASFSSLAQVNSDSKGFKPAPSNKPATKAGSQAAPVVAPKPQLEIICYSGGVNISSGARQYFFPYKTIQFLQLERKTDSTGNSSWALHIRTDRDKINLESGRNLEGDFRALMVAYRGS